MQQLSLSETINEVEQLIENGNGDLGRLYHILEFLKSNKPLYHSDQIYLESKLDTSIREEIPVKPAEIKKITKKVTPEVNLEERQQEPQKTETIPNKEKGAMPQG